MVPGELKNIYDSYPDAKFVFSGSSSIDLIKGTSDLSRRGVLYRIGGMSFREYLLFNNIAEIDAFSLDELLTDRAGFEEKISGIKKIKGHFRNYIGKGYYPFLLEDENTYNQKILRIIEATGYKSKIGTIREIFFIKMIRNSGNRIFYSRTGDFEVNKNIFEIVGKNKDWKQLKGNTDNSYIVKDDILYGFKNEIPLFLFGFLY